MVALAQDVEGLILEDERGIQMARRVFFSFHYEADSWRAAQIRNAGVVEGNRPVTDNQWESIRRGGETAIRNWIDDQLYGKSCLIVLIGSNTANRKWINYEISKAWNEKKGVLGVHIHNLRDQHNKTSSKGSNPFRYVVDSNGKRLANLVTVYDPPVWPSAHLNIVNYMEEWVEHAIQDRNWM